MDSAPRLQVLAAAVLFSTGGAAIKATALRGFQVACLRSALAAVALALLVPSWRGVFKLPQLAVGTCYAATMILYVLANKLTTAANAIFLQATAPMYLLLLGPWLLREAVRFRDVALTVAIAGGLALFFVGVEPAQATAPDPLLGNLIGAASGLTWAFTILGLRWLGRSSRAGSGAAGGAVVAGNVIAALAAAPLAFPIATVRPVDALAIGYLGLFQVGLAYVFMTRGVSRVPALEASLLLMLEPVLNTLWAWLLHGEIPGPSALAGSALILFATLAHTLRRA